MEHISFTCTTGFASDLKEIQKGQPHLLAYQYSRARLHRLIEHLASNGPVIRDCVLLTPSAQDELVRSTVE